MMPQDIEAAISSARRELERAPAVMRDHFAAVVELLEQLRDRDRQPNQPEQPQCR